jgi:site-specific recombinase XerD
LCLFRHRFPPFQLIGSSLEDGKSLPFIRRLIMSTALRLRMDNAMLVRGLADRTRQSYLEAITKLTRYYRLSPDTLTAAQVEAWLLYLVRERHLSFSTVNQAASACRLFYHTVLGRDQASFIIPMAKTAAAPTRDTGQDRSRHAAGCYAGYHQPHLLMTIYAAGLRVSEACSLQVTDIDSAPDRLCLRVRQGKGGQDRYTLLAPTLLTALREYWRLRQATSLAVSQPGWKRPHRHQDRATPLQSGTDRRAHPQDRRCPHPASLLRHPLAGVRR